MTWAVVGAPQAVVAGGADQYPSFPFAWVTAAGTRLVAYRNWDGANNCNHTAGGAGWLIRNEGSPTLLMDDLAQGQIQEAWVYQPPGGTTVVYLALSGGTTHHYKTSTDEGATWSASALATMNSPFSGGINLHDIIVSQDGTKVLATAYGYQGGGSGNNFSAALLESTDGITWSRRSWIARHDDAVGQPASEVGLIRMPGGRLLAVMRHDIGAQNGWTSYSDDDGATWSTRAQLTGFEIHSPRGLGFTSTRAVVFGRDRNGGVTYQPLSQWILSETGAKVSGPHAIQRSQDTDGGYPCLHWEPDIGPCLYYYSEYGDGSHLPKLCKAVMRGAGSSTATVVSGWTGTGTQADPYRPAVNSHYPGGSIVETGRATPPASGTFSVTNASGVLAAARRDRRYTFS